MRMIGTRRGQWWTEGGALGVAFAALMAASRLAAGTVHHRHGYEGHNVHGGDTSDFSAPMKVTGN